MPVRLISPYTQPVSGKSGQKRARARWLRGNLHMHTTRSDGSREPQVAVDDYANRGYDFIMISDHDLVTSPSLVNPRGMVLIPGNEISARNPHMLHVNADERIEPLADRQKVIDAVRHKRDQFIILNHANYGPHYNHCPIEKFIDWQGYLGLEIYNGKVETEAGNPLATDKWDAMLSRGRIVWGYANDDSHHDDEVERAWNMVLATEKSRKAIVSALKAGRSYGTTGVKISTIDVTGPVLRIHAPNAEQMRVISAFSQVIHTVKGSKLEFDASDVTKSYIRVECVGKNGAMAWTQPFFLSGGTSSRLDRLLKQRPELTVLRVHALPPFGSPTRSGFWKQAPRHGRFLELQTGKSAADQTCVQGLSDGKHLLLSIDCDESAMKNLNCRVTAHNDPSVWADDSVEIFIDPTGDGTSYWQIMINANGFACAVKGNKTFVLPNLQTQASHRENGWRVEALLSLAELGAPADLATCRINIGRTHCAAGRLKRRNSTWKWVGESFHAPHFFGLLRFANASR